MPAWAMPIQEVRHLTTAIHKADGAKTTITFTSFPLHIGEFFGVVTESGAAKPASPFPSRGVFTARPVLCPASNCRQIGGWQGATDAALPPAFTESLPFGTGLPATPFAPPAFPHAAGSSSGQDDWPQRLWHPPAPSPDKE